MALEKIIIQVGSQADLQATIKKLEELGAVDEKNSKAFQLNSKESQSSIDQTTSKLGGFQKALTNIGPVLAGAFAVSQLVSFGKSVIDITAKFQKFDAVLTNTLGSKSEAQKALKMIKDFAASTPFAVDELTESFVKLANQGFKPTQEEMRKLGDLAASQGKSFNQLTEAIIDAQTGEFERLKEFGIRASKAGDKVIFTFKGVQTQTDFTSASIQKYVLGLGDVQGVSGGMAAISQTLGGQISNLGDSFDALQVAIGSSLSSTFSGIISMFGSMLTSLTEIIDGSDSATASFNKQKQAVDELEKNTVPLIARYEELAGKSNRSKAEQEELDKIIVQIGKDIPTAITQFDEYGKAIGISAEEAKKFVTQQKAILAIKNKEAIDEQVEALEKLNIKIRAYQRELKDGTKLQADMDGATFSVKLTGKEITNLQANLANLQFQKLGVTGLIDELKGVKKEVVAVVETVKTEERELTEFEKLLAAEREKIRKKELDDRVKDQIAFEKMKKDAAVSNVIIDPITDSKKTEEEAKKTNEVRKKAMAERNKNYADSIKKDIEETKKAEEAELKRIAEVKQANQIYQQTAFQAAGILEAALQAAGDRKTESQLSQLDAQTQAELDAVDKRLTKGRISEEVAAREKEKIMKKAAEKEAAIKTKQAKDNKKFALMNIALDTAQAILRGIAQFGPPPSPAGIAAIVAATITGGLQAAIVASTPIPKFKDGVLDLKGKGTGTSDSILARLSKGESVMTAQETINYRGELEAMRKGTYEKYRMPITRRQSLSEARHEGMANAMYNSMMQQNSFDDMRIVGAIKGSARSGKDDVKLAKMIGREISDRSDEKGLFA